MSDTAQMLDLLTEMAPAVARERALSLAVAAERSGDRLSSELFHAAATVGPDPARAERIADLAARSDRVDPRLSARAYEYAASLEASDHASARRLISRAEALLRTDPAAAAALIPNVQRAELTPVDRARIELVEHELHFGQATAPHVDLGAHIVAMANVHPSLALRASVMSAFEAWWRGDRRSGAELMPTIAAVAVAPDDLALRALQDFALGVFAVLGNESSGGKLAASAAAAAEAQAEAPDPLLEVIELAVRVLLVYPGAVHALLSRVSPESEPVEAALRAIQAANHGEAEACREFAATAIESGVRDGQHWAASLALAAMSRLELGLGNLDPSLTMLQRISDPDDILGHPVTARLIAADRVEAAARSGRIDLARDVITELERWSGDEGDFSRVVLTRLRALQAEPNRAQVLFDEAVTRAAGTVFEEGRTRLLYGEHLRRTRRRVLAREQLRLAGELFDSAGAVHWVLRANRELQATAETARRDPESDTAVHLTPRERQVAELVASGASNQEVAEQLIMSRKTVEHHLHNIYSRYGLSARTEIITLLDRTIEGDIK